MLDFSSAPRFASLRTSLINAHSMQPSAVECIQARREAMQKKFISTLLKDLKWLLIF